MNLRELLTLPVLAQAGVRVLAGEEHLEREVQWVHTGEIADIARYLTGGEVLLTAATGLETGEAARRAYIRELAEVGVSAIIVELGRGFRAVPDAMIEEARRGGVVLVALENEVPFVAVTHSVHTLLINADHVALVRATEIDEALSQAILDGASLGAVLELLADRLACPVVLEDANHRVVAFGRGPRAINPLLKQWQAHSRDAHSTQAGAIVNLADGERRCAWSNLTLRGEVWGRLHIVEGDSPLDDVARLSLGRAVTSIALLLLSERDAYLSDEAENALIRGVAAGGDFSGQEFVDRAASLGISFGSELVLLVTEPTTSKVGQAEDGQLAELVQMVRAALGDIRWPGVVGRVDHSVVVVAETSPGSTLEKAQALAAIVSSRSPEGHLGMSRPCRAAALPRAFREAVMAYRLSPLIEGAELRAFDDLALLRLLASIAAGPELATFVEGELGGLLDYDEHHSSELVRTLDAFLQANGNKQETGRLLHLRRRSVYYRLGRIEKTLGYSLDLPDRRARLYIALRGRELLREQGHQT